MGILKSLFGSPKPSYDVIIQNVAAGGGEGIVQTQYEGFAQHLQNHADIIQLTPESLSAEYSLGNDEVIVHINRERSNGKVTGRTIVFVQNKIPINWRDPKIGEVIASAHKDFIKNKSDAKNAAISIYYAGQRRFVEDSQAGGEIKMGAQSSATIPPSLKKFAANIPEDQICTEHDWIRGLIEHSTREAGDTELRVEVIYAIADAIVREYQLV